MKILDEIHALRRDTIVAINAFFLALYPFAGDMITFAHEQLPSLAQYLPANIFKFVGPAVVVLNIVVAAVRSSRARRAAP